MNQWKPHPRQIEALRRTEFETLYGGARGGGKTDSGMAWLLREIENPTYRALVIRQNATDLTDWIDRAKIMFSGTRCSYTGSPPTFEFPSGAKIILGHLKDESAYEKYQGHEYQRILIEELTQIPTEERYLRLLASCRSTNDIKPRIFCTTNPGGVGHYWVKKRFIDPARPGVSFFDKKTNRGRVFISATIEDNPTLMEKDPEYINMLEGLPDQLKQAWRYGNWDLQDVKGIIFSEECQQLEEERRFTELEFNRNSFTNVYFDLGMGGKADDQTAVFVQVQDRKIKVVDSFTTAKEGKGRVWDYYPLMLKERKFNYGNIFLPHDGNRRSPESLISFKNVLENAGYNVKILPRTNDKERDLQKLREIFSRLWIDKNCEDVLESLRNYRREYDDSRGIFKAAIYHDWTSHYVDAMLAMAVSHEDPKPPIKPRQTYIDRAEQAIRARARGF